MLTPRRSPKCSARSRSRVDAWLIYDFRGCNPVAAGFLGLEGLQTRRVFAFVPREGRGVPTAIIHNIEPGPWRRWPNEWRRERYSGWRELETLVAGLVSGKRVAMEYSAGDAVPVLDRVPAGVVEMVRGAGATVVSSGELVSRFYATLSASQIASHERAAETIAAIAHGALRLAGECARAVSRDEHQIHQWIHAPSRVQD